jgi:hypothetical protein
MSSTPINAPISGTPYPTLSGKPGVTTFSNPPFHPNILNIPNNLSQLDNAGAAATGRGFNSGGNLQRGRLLTDPTQNVYNGNSLGNVQYQVNFLYNPSTITESRGVDLNSGVVPSQYRAIGDPTQYATGLNTTVGFSLLFDRTFELWDAAYIDQDAGKYGVRTDVEALYNLVGINYGSPTSAITGGVVSPTGGAQASNVTVQGTMTVAPCHLYFGATNQWSLNYYGFISSFNVTWTHFTFAMVPQRCAVDIQFTVLPTTTSSLVAP